MKRISAAIFLSALVRMSFSQIALINTSNAFYLFDQKNGSCTLVDGGSYCNQGAESIFSTALHKDTLYFISSVGLLYRMKLGDISSCILLTSFPITSNINSLVAGADGLIYAAEWPTGVLYRYNPYKNVKENLGQINARPGGDLMFYKGKLLMATDNFTIYEININNPSASTVFMNTATYNFFGLISVPYNCTTNKYYGLALIDAVRTELVELDMENKRVLGATCALPIEMFDAASNLDDGTTLGVTIDSIKFQPPCGQDSLANIFINASAGSPRLTYILDGALTNNTGAFYGIKEGQHSLKVSNNPGCYKDSTITINHGLGKIEINSVSPGCDHQTGSISISGTSGYHPILYSLNGAGFQTGSSFTNLVAGTYTLKIIDAAGCEKDTGATISKYIISPYAISIDTLQPSCQQIHRGQITATVSGTQEPYFLRSGNLNYGNGQPIKNLTAGTYDIIVLNRDNCPIDTVSVQLSLKYSPECDRLSVPSAFTPNSDGLNDVFKVLAGEGIIDFRLSVYDRWGQLIFSTTDKAKGWDGGLKGMSQPVGIYVWTLSYKTLWGSSKKLAKGTVTLIR
jgi:gliding motility-associated-like protein